jgi:quercetin dioxygenase-like cupin family protein
MRTTEYPATPRPRHRSSSIAAAFTLLLALLVTLAPSAAAQPEDPPGRILRDVPSRSLTVLHGPVVTTLTTAGSDGHQLGDLRVASLPLSSEDGEEGSAGRLDATLLTTGIDSPNPGDEIRISTLVFTLGDDQADQVIVTGSGPYHAAGSTIAIDSVIVRPIVGGSGRFAGATGWAETEHLADDTWRHTLHFTGPGLGRIFRALPERPQRGDRERGERRLPARPDGTQDAAIIRTPLGQTEPATADGETLGLWHYLIPAGAELPPHTHPGYQVARIVSGLLTYEVVSGEALVTRRDGSSETAAAGATVTLTPGDTIVESPGMVHFAHNAGRRPVTIVSATLFETGAEPATAVESATAVEPATESAAPTPLASAQPLESPAA